MVIASAQRNATQHPKGKPSKEALRQSGRDEERAMQGQKPTKQAKVNDAGTWTRLFWRAQKHRREEKRRQSGGMHPGD